MLYVEVVNTYAEEYVSANFSFEPDEGPAKLRLR